MEILADRAFMENTFFIKVDNQTASAYCLTRNDRQYLVTAKHAFPKNMHNDTVKVWLWKDEKWNLIEARVMFHETDSIDIAVLPLKGSISQPYNVVIGTAGMNVGSETFFYGFPYQMSFSHKGFNNGYPLPLVKRATISTFYQKGYQNPNPFIIYLDGMNNPGFSGGPIGHTVANTLTTYLYGFISGYRPERKNIVTPIGEFPYLQNSGIIIAYAADHALQIIARK